MRPAFLVSRREQGMYATHFDASAGLQLAARHPDHEETPSTADMGAATFADIHASLSNVPCYSYCHQGCCEHVLEVRDVRQIHDADPQSRSSYPMQLVDKSTKMKR
ncbi:MAG: hypothetical protein WDW38_002561 [Sanguina aurantia]